MSVAQKIKKTILENYPIIAVLVGVALVSLSVGPYTNGDMAWEFDAASGVLRWGIPYVNIPNNIMNQPPLAFYIEALFFKIFGASITNGVALITVFGLGCTALLYKVGKDLYGKTTGLFAAALFALTQWELVLSRSFLIDVPSLFFSLTCLLFGIWAIRKDSVKLSLAAGVFFAAAFMTKLFAVFILIPLLLFLLYRRPTNRRLLIKQLLAFGLPVVFASFFWYQLVLGKGVFFIFNHDDLSYPNVEGVVPTYFFVANFLVTHGLGVLFAVATVFSLAMAVAFRKQLGKIASFDLICLGTIVPILTLDIILGATLNLKSPYLNAVKYDYYALPFFSLLAASLAAKCRPLLKTAGAEVKRNTRLAAAGLVLLGATVLASMSYVHQFSILDFIIFPVEGNRILGYSLDNHFPVTQNSPLMLVQYLGFIVVLSGFVWAGRKQIINLRKAVRYRLKRGSSRDYVHVIGWAAIVFGVIVLLSGGLALAFLPVAFAGYVSVWMWTGVAVCAAGFLAVAALVRREGARLRLKKA
jgi:4-amino-4-deoxy-L-arabinose transferase-like glycosyltransferase